MTSYDFSDKDIKDLEEKVEGQTKEINNLTQRILDLQEILNLIPKTSQTIEKFIPHLIVSFAILFLGIYAFYKFE